MQLVYTLVELARYTEIARLKLGHGYTFAVVDQIQSALEPIGLREATSDGRERHQRPDCRTYDGRTTPCMMRRGFHRIPFPQRAFKLPYRHGRY
ncbi:hypothetical protein [Nocardia niwae]|uniref:hypothetical protein n=1 Tax=Nocardia niwae TaxID=626084 RepID=UPI000AA4E2E4|nr:hypothetical protein [Nocardia niwae]